jgi:hypothetical protein
VRRHLPLHVSLPGAAVQMAVFPLDVLPNKHAVRLDLARWHFTQAATRSRQMLVAIHAQGLAVADQFPGVSTGSMAPSPIRSGLSNMSQQLLSQDQSQAVRLFLARL